jgi:Tol biopolymer transport system component
VINRQMTEIHFEIECRPLARSGVIAFVENSMVMLMNEDGSGIGQLNRGWHPSWSRDGTRLVYSTTDCDEYSCTGSLEIVDPATRQIVALPNAGSAWTPAWSPVDDVIAFVDPESASVFLYDIAKATKSRVVIERPVWVLFHPSWSPDGSKLAGACNESDGRVNVCVFNRDGTGFHYLTSDASLRDNEPSWSPDGSRIVFTRYSTTSSKVAVVNADGSGLRTVTDGRWPAWSPDGTEIIFSGSRGLHTINIDGTGLNQLTDGLHYSAVWRR